MRPSAFSRLSASAATLLFLVRCVTDTPGTGDGGADAAADTGAVVDAADAGVVDAGAEAEASAPACDPKKNFAAPVAVTLQNEVQPVMVYGFKVRAGATHVYVQRGQSQLEQGAIVDHTIQAFPGLANVYGAFFTVGVDVAPDELSMLHAVGGAIARVTRLDLGSKFANPVLLPISLPPLDASLNIMFQVAIAPGVISFARTENSMGAQVADLFEARPNPDGGAYPVVAIGGAHVAGPYVGRPALRDENNLYFTAWGSMTSPHQRVYLMSRPNPSAAWGAPVGVAIDGFTPKATDDIVPLETSADDCTLYFGVAVNNVDGPYAVYQARRPQ